VPRLTAGRAGADSDAIGFAADIAGLRHINVGGANWRSAFRAPGGVRADKIEAYFTKGVLIIKLPKTAEAQAETTIR